MNWKTLIISLSPPTRRTSQPNYLLSAGISPKPLRPGTSIVLGLTRISIQILQLLQITWNRSLLSSRQALSPRAPAPASPRTVLISVIVSPLSARPIVISISFSPIPLSIPIPVSLSISVPTPVPISISIIITSLSVPISIIAPFSHSVSV